jgi:hypothetical protein
MKLSEPWCDGNSETRLPFAVLFDIGIDRRFP